MMNHKEQWIVFGRIGEHASLDLFCFVNLTSSCSLSPLITVVFLFPVHNHWPCCNTFWLAASILRAWKRPPPTHPLPPPPSHTHTHSHYSHLECRSESPPPHPVYKLLHTQMHMEAWNWEVEGEIGKKEMRLIMLYAQNMVSAGMLSSRASVWWVLSLSEKKQHWKLKWF